MNINDPNLLITNYLGHMKINKSSYDENIRLLASVYVYHAY